MDTFIVKKLAEVQAFIDLSSMITKKAGPEFACRAPHISSLLIAVGTDSIDLLQDPEQQILFQKKLDKTITKLERIMELYVGNEWDNNTEVLEWLSFYAGSAAAHTALTAGALSIMSSDERLALLSDQFSQLLQAGKDALYVVGIKHATLLNNGFGRPFKA